MILNHLSLQLTCPASLKQCAIESSFLKFGQAPAMASRHLQIPLSHSIELFKPENSKAKGDCRATFKPVKGSKQNSRIWKIRDTNIHGFEQ